MSVKEAHSSRRPRAGVLGWTCSAVDSSGPARRLLSAFRWLDVKQGLTRLSRNRPRRNFAATRRDSSQSGGLVALADGSKSKLAI